MLYQGNLKESPPSYFGNGIRNSFKHKRQRGKTLCNNSQTRHRGKKRGKILRGQRYSEVRDIEQSELEHSEIVRSEI